MQYSRSNADSLSARKEAISSKEKLTTHETAKTFDDQVHEYVGTDKQRCIHMYRKGEVKLPARSFTKLAPARVLGLADSKS